MQAMLIREMPERTTEDTGDRWNALTLRERRDTFPSPFKNIRKSLGSTVGRVVRRVLRKSKVHTLDHQYDSVAPYSQQAASSSTANEKLTTSETDSQIVLTSFKTVILKGTKRACVAVSDGKVKLDDKNAKPKAMTTTLQQCSMDVNNCPSATQNSCTVNRTTSAAATGQESATGDQSSSAAIPVRTTTSQSSNMSGVSQHNNSNDDMDDELMPSENASYVDSTTKQRTVTIAVKQMAIQAATTDAILNAANKELEAGGGVDGAIRNAAGQLKLLGAIRALKRSRRSDTLDDGEVVVTEAFDLTKNGVEHILHTAAPIIRRKTLPDRYDEMCLRLCYYNALRKAEELDAKSLTMPFLGTGIYNYPKDEGIFAALETATGYFEGHPDGSLEEIVFATLSDQYVVHSKLVLENNDRITFEKTKSAEIKEKLQLQRFKKAPTSKGTLPDGTTFGWTSTSEKQGAKRMEIIRKIDDLLNRPVSPSPLTSPISSANVPIPAPPPVKKKPLTEGERSRRYRENQGEEDTQRRKERDRLRQKDYMEGRAYALRKIRRNHERREQNLEEARRKDAERRRNHPLYREYAERTAEQQRIRRSDPVAYAQELLAKRTNRTLRALTKRMAISQTMLKHLPEKRQAAYKKRWTNQGSQMATALGRLARLQIQQPTDINSQASRIMNRIRRDVSGAECSTQSSNGAESSQTASQTTTAAKRRFINMTRDILRKNRRAFHGRSLTQHLPVDVQLINLCNSWQSRANSGSKWKFTVTTLLAGRFRSLRNLRPTNEELQAAAIEIECRLLKVEKIAESTEKLITSEIQRVHRKVTAECKLQHLTPQERLKLIIGGFHLHVATSEHRILVDDRYIDARELYPEVVHQLHRAEIQKMAVWTTQPGTSMRNLTQTVQVPSQATQQQIAENIMEHTANDEVEEIREDPEPELNLQDQPRPPSQQQQSDSPDRRYHWAENTIWMRRPDEECANEIPKFDWAERLQAVLLEATKDGYVPEKIEAFVENFNNCKKCDESTCNRGITCGKLSDLMKTLEPHYMNIRTLRRIYYNIEKSAEWLKVWRQFSTSRHPQLCDLEWLTGEAVSTAATKKLLADAISIDYSDNVKEWYAKKEFARHLREFSAAVSDVELITCASCNRLRRNADMMKKEMSEEELQFVFEDSAEEETNKGHRICKECHSEVRHNRMPKLCRRNNMELDEIPPQLQNLKNWLEQTMISQVRLLTSVMTLTTRANKTGHRAYKGNVLHMEMPIVGTVTKVLDTLPSTEHTFVIAKYDGQRVKAKTYVDIRRVIEALKWLQINNPLYANVRIANAAEQKKIFADANLEVSDDEDEEPMETDDEAQQGQADDDGVQAGSPMLTLVPNIDAPNTDVPDIDVDHTAVVTINPAQMQSTKDIYFKLKHLNTRIIRHNEKNLDLRAFPVMFPKGRFGMNATRDPEVRSFMYVRARLLCADRRFAKNDSWIIAMHNTIEQTRMLSEVNVWMKKTATVRSLVDSLKSDTVREMYSFMENIKGSPQYWSVCRQELQAMVAHFGAPTFFVTCNPNEANMDDLREAYLKIHGAAATDKQNVYDLSKLDVPMYARHNHFRFKALFDNLFKNRKAAEGIFGKLEHYWYRIEYQMRGAPHCHMLLWIKDAPTLETSTEEEVIRFIDGKITCRMPDPTTEPDLYNLVVKNQSHYCNPYCTKSFIQHKKVKTRCRFGFPLDSRKESVLNKELLDKADPMKRIRTYDLKRSEEARRVNAYNPALLLAWRGNVDVQYVGTTSLAVLEYVTSYVSKNESKSTGQGIDPFIDRMDKSKALSFGFDMLRKRQMSIPEVCDHLLGHPCCKSSDQVEFLNNNSREKRGRMLIRKAELDWRVANNATGESATKKNIYDDYYPQRPEAMSGLSLYTVFAAFNYSKTKPTTRKRGRQPNRNPIIDEEMPSEEGSDNGQGIPMEIDSDHERSQLIANQVDPNMDEEAVDSESSCNSGAEGEEAVVSDVDLGEHDDANQDANGEEEENISADSTRPFFMFPEGTIFGNEESGYWKARRKRKVARFFLEDVIGADEAKLEERCRRILFMFKPWRNEDELMGSNETYAEALETFYDECTSMAREEIETIVGGRQLLCDALRAKRLLRQEREQAMADEEIELDVPPFLAPAIDTSSNEVEQMMNGLNVEQRRIYNEVIGRLVLRQTRDACLHENATTTTVRLGDEAIEMDVLNSDDQGLVFDTETRENRSLFVSGIAGTGKSYLISALVRRIINDYDGGEQNRAKPSVLIAAPTGLAALNVGGLTLHSLLKIEVEHNITSPYKPLRGALLSELSDFLKRCRLLIVDEISMVSNVLLTKIHMRLQEIMANNKPFGGMLILTFGDLMQLPPVRLPSAPVPVSGRHMRSVFKTSPFTLRLWDLYDYAELTINMRQGEGSDYAKLLERMRVNSMTSEDIDALLSRSITASSGSSSGTGLPPRANIEDAVNYFYDTMKNVDSKLMAVFSYSETVRVFNDRILEKRQAEDPEVNVILEIPAETNEVEKAIGKKPFLQRGYRHADVIRGEFGRKGRNHRQSAKDAKAAGGLEATLFLQKGCRIMQIQNDRSGQGTGIVNGSRGELIDFVMEDGKIDSLIVKFDHMDSETRVARVSTTYRTKNGKMWTRLQFPIVLAYAATIHKCQGMTVDNMMMDLYDCFSHGQAYVAASRVRTIAGLHLVNMHPAAVILDQTILGLYNSLRKSVNLLEVHSHTKEELASLSARFGPRKGREAYKNEFLMLKPEVQFAQVAAKKTKSKRATGTTRQRLPATKDSTAKAQMDAQTGPHRHEVRDVALRGARDLDVNDRDSVLFINPAAPNQWRCFGNSVMQLLGRTPLYKSISEFNRLVPQAENSVVKTFLNLLKETTYIGEKRDVRLVVEKVGRNFIGVQSCAAEFAERLLEKLFEATGLEYLAQIRLTDNAICQDCEHTTQRQTDSHLIWHVPVRQNRDLTVQELIEQSKNSDDNDGGYQCPACGSRRIRITTGVACHSECRTLFISQKLFPNYRDPRAEVRLRNYEDNITLAGYTWRICGIVHHFGGNIEGGHYMAITRGERAWTVHNDDSNPRSIQSIEDEAGFYIICLERAD